MGPGVGPVPYERSRGGTVIGADWLCHCDGRGWPSTGGWVRWLTNDAGVSSVNVDASQTAHFRGSLDDEVAWTMPHCRQT